MNEESYDIIRTYWELKEDVLFPFSDELLEDFPNERDIILDKRRRFNAVVESLPRITVEDIAQCKNNLQLAIHKVLQIISANRSGYPLARNQGLIIENYIYGKVLDVIRGAVKSPLGYGYPNFYYEIGGDFDSAPLIRLLETYRQNVQEARFTSYLQFADLFEGFRSSVRQMWIDENQRRLRRE